MILCDVMAKVESNCEAGCANGYFDLYLQYLAVLVHSRHSDQHHKIATSIQTQWEV